MIFKNLFSFIRTNKRIFAVFLLVQIATVVAFFSVFNYALMFLENAKELQSNCRTYSVSIFDGESLDAQMKKLYEKYADMLTDYYAVMNNGNDRIYCEYIRPSDNIIQNGKNFSENDFKDGKKQMLFADYSGMTDKKKYKIGEQYELLGEQYEIIGVSYKDVLIIPYGSLKDKSQISEVYMVLNTDLKSVYQDVFLQDVMDIFNADSVSTPSAYSMSTYSSTINYVATFGVIIIIAVINIIYLYSYIMNKRKKETAVFRLCGCSLGKTASMYLTEILFLSAVSYAVAVLIHLVAVMPLMMNITQSLKYYISPLDFIIVYVIYLLIEILSFLPIIQRVAKTSPSVLSKE